MHRTPSSPSCCLASRDSARSTRSVRCRRASSTAMASWTMRCSRATETSRRSSIGRTRASHLMCSTWPSASPPLASLRRTSCSSSVVGTSCEATRRDDRSARRKSLHSLTSCGLAHSPAAFTGVPARSCTINPCLHTGHMSCSPVRRQVARVQRQPARVLLRDQGRVPHHAAPVREARGDATRAGRVARDDTLVCAVLGIHLKGATHAGRILWTHCVGVACGGHLVATGDGTAMTLRNHPTGFYHPRDTPGKIMACSRVRSCG